jgi:hypothetical protein
LKNALAYYGTKINYARKTFFYLSSFGNSKMICDFFDALTHTDVPIKVDRKIIFSSESKKTFKTLPILEQKPFQFLSPFLARVFFFFDEKKKFKKRFLKRETVKVQSH